MSNDPKFAVLYTGIAGDLTRRVWQHKNRIAPGFTSRYNLTRLVYYERFFYPDAAINREKEIKGWRRSKKIKLIESMNPRWDDLAEDWQKLYKPAPGSDRREIPRPAGESAGLRDDAVDEGTEYILEDHVLARSTARGHTSAIARNSGDKTPRSR